MKSRRRVNSTVMPRRFLKTQTSDVGRLVQAVAIARAGSMGSLKSDIVVARSASQCVVGATHPGVA
jgi:hypothetical protein